MSKHLIFLVHGMGIHAAGWSNDAWETLKAAYARYTDLEEIPFDDHFERVEVIYDDRFEVYRQKMSEDAQAVGSLMDINKVAPDVIARLVDLSLKLNRNSFFTTHILDVFFYYLIAQIQADVRSSVRRKIADTLENTPAGDPVEWSIIAHSLGTSVAHDVLHQLYQPGPGSLGGAAVQFPPQSGLFVANLSRLLQTNVKAYSSLVRPSVGRTTGIFDYFLNASHKLDPFTKLKPFDPGYDWLDPLTRTAQPPRYQLLEISEILDVNVHALTHYLDNPQVHIPFIRALFGRHNIIGPESERTAIAAYQATASAAQMNAVRDQLINLTDNQKADIAGLLDVGQWYGALIR